LLGYHHHGLLIGHAMNRHAMIGHPIDLFPPETCLFELWAGAI
jgi:hypothetical protein